MANHSFSNRRLWGESLLATILVFMVMWVFFTLITVSVKPLNYFARTLKDIHSTDIYFAHLNNDRVDTNIVLVNIGELDRKGIADLVGLVAGASPRTIALDVIFDDRDDPEGDILLELVFRRHADKLILAGEFNPADSSFNTKVKVFDGPAYGHCNLATDEARTEPVRSFHPLLRTGQGMVPSFSAMIAEQWRPGTLKELQDMERAEMPINYTGGKDAFKVVHHTDLMHPGKAALLKDKIVMLGFLSGGKDDRLQDMDDMFYTPMNTKYFGRSHPDMSGVVVHANIASMIIRNDHIKEIPKWLMALLSFIIVYLHVVPFAFFYVRKHLWYHVFAKIMQLVSIIVLLLLTFHLLAHHGVLLHNKYILIGVFLAVDVLYLYESLAVGLYKTTRLKSMFVQDH